MFSRSIALRAVSSVVFVHACRIHFGFPDEFHANVYLLFGSCYVAEMKKRRLSAEDDLLSQYHTLRQIPTLSHADCRKVLQLLNDDKEQKGTFVASRTENKFPVTMPALRDLVIRDEQEECLFHAFSLPECVQNKVKACKAFAELFEMALTASSNALELLLFWDETTPGNVLAPDLRRKAAMWYISFQELPSRTADTAWLTLAVCRSQELQKVKHGFAKSMTALLMQLKEDCKDGFMIDLESGPQLVFLRSIVVFMDADGIRLTLGNKGSSGFKPCWRCQNVVGLQHFDLPGTIHMSNPDVRLFQMHTVESLRETQMYLRSVRGKTAKEKAETLLGWNCEAMLENFLLQPNLSDLVDANKVLYDPMHCFVSNGLCNQELGYWWQAVTTQTPIRTTQLRHYALTCWKSNEQYPDTVRGAFADKCWVTGKDYRGGAAETLLVLPLCVAFCLEVLQDKEELQKENASLLALYDVICAWLRCKHKRCNDFAHLQALQTRHASQFMEAYGKEWARPKLHYSRHLPWQFARGYLVDAFPTERTHAYFKSHVAPKRKKLKDFSKFVLLEMGEQDLKMNQHESLCKPTLLGKVSHCPKLAAAAEDPNAAVAPRISCEDVTHGKGQFKILTARKAVEIMGACQLHSKFFLLCMELTFVSEIAPTLTRWHKPRQSTQFSLLRLEDAQKAQSQVYYRIESNLNVEDVWLLG